MPENVGYRMGNSENSFSWIKLQFHFDNPDSISGMVDNSGLKIYYTTELREHDAGIVILGDPLTSGLPLEPGQKRTERQFTCPSSCTSNMPWSITVISSFLHMHATGSQVIALMYPICLRQAWSTHFRSNSSLGALNTIEYYDYGFQSFNPVNKVIAPGDEIQTHCVWDTTLRTEETPFGIPSNNEM